MIDTILQILIAGFTAYIWTALIAASHIFKPVRRVIRSLFWQWLPRSWAETFVKWETRDGKAVPILEDADDLDLDGREIQGYDMISCRLCAGFWVSMIVGFSFMLPWIYWMAVYGVGYWLTTQERQ